MRWPNSVIVAIGVKFSPWPAAQADGRDDRVDEAVEADERRLAADEAAARGGSCWRVRWRNMRSEEAERPSKNRARRGRKQIRARVVSPRRR